MQDPEHSVREVGQRLWMRGHVAVVGADGDRVDREVAALEVPGKGRAKLDLGQRPGARVALAPGRSQIEGDLARAYRGGAETVMRAHLALQSPGQPLRHLGRSALHDEVDLDRPALQEDIAHRPAHDVHSWLRLGGAQHGGRVRKCPQTVDEVGTHVGLHHGEMTGRGRGTELLASAACRRKASAFGAARCCSARPSSPCCWSSPSPPTPGRAAGPCATPVWG